MRLISKQAFRQYMKFRATTRAWHQRSAPWRPSHSFGRPGRGACNTVSPETASRIEAALNAPTGSLLRPRYLSLRQAESGGRLMSGFDSLEQSSPIVQVADGVPTTTSMRIASGTRVQHKNVLELIRGNLADFEEFGGRV